MCVLAVGYQDAGLGMPEFGQARLKVKERLVRSRETRKKLVSGEE